MGLEARQTVVQDVPGIKDLLLQHQMETVDAGLLL